MNREKYHLSVYFVLAVVFTSYVIYWSSHYGKLSVPPDYDDSHSMVEGAIRLLNFKAEGFQAAWDEYRLRNTHSFLHYYWPSILYSVFGVHQSVVYWGNGIFLFGVLLAFRSMLPCIHEIWKMVWIVAFLGMPFCFHLVHDFRSEVTMASLIFMGCAAALSWTWDTGHTRVCYALTATCFALALGVKPVMFPYTLGMLALCSVVYLSANWLCSRGLPNQNETHVISLSVKTNSQSLRQPLAWIAGLWAMVLLPSSVHFFIYRNYILGYIQRVAFHSDFYKQKSVDASGWIMHWQDAAHAPVWAFHWLGWSGVWHLSVLRGFFAVILAVGVSCWLIPRVRQYAADRKNLSLTFLTLGAYAGIAFNSVDQYFFGMTFQMLLAATALSWIASLFSKGLPLWVPIGFVSIFGVLYVNPALNRPVIASVLITSAPMALIARYSGIKKCERVAFICSGVLALLCWLTTEIAPYNNYVQRTISEAGTAGLEWRRQGPREVYEIIDKSLQDLPVTGTPIVWCSEHGWMDGRTVAWEAVKRGKRWMVFTETELSKPSHAVYPKYSDYIVIAGPEIMGSIKTPDSTTSIDVKALLQTDKNLQCVGEVNDPAGGTIAVLKNLDSHKNQNPEQACPDWLEAKIKRLSRIN